MILIINNNKIIQTNKVDSIRQIDKIDNKVE